MLAGKVPVGSAVPPRNTAPSGKGSKVLVVNAGSSSIKFKIFTAETLLPGAAGLFDRIGEGCGAGTCGVGACTNPAPGVSASSFRDNNHPNQLPLDRCVVAA